DYSLRQFKVAVQVPEGDAARRKQIVKALESLTAKKDSPITVVDDLRQAEWLVRLEKGQLQLIEASGNRVPSALPAPDSTDLSAAVSRNLERVFRARNLIALAQRFEEQRYRGSAAVDVEVEVLRHKDEESRGEVLPRPTDGWRFRPGDRISFRLKNKS